MTRLLAMLVLAGCWSSTAPTPTPTPTPTPPPIKPTAGVEEPYRCAKDADCFVSCAYGAVSRAWYDAAKLQECKDGCAEGRVATCVSQACVASWDNGKVDTGCTHRPIVAP